MSRNGNPLMVAATELNAIPAVRSTLLMTVMGQTILKLTIKRTHKPNFIIMDRPKSLALRLLERQQTHVILKTVK